jgi:hypothetical protein
MVKKTLHPDISTLPERELRRLTLFGEVRGEPLDGIAGVSSVLDNRIKDGRWGPTLASVVGAWAQFSCLWPELGGANFNAVLGAARAIQRDDLSPTLLLLGYIGDGTANGVIPDLTHGATHYHTSNLDPRPMWTKPPAWVTARLGHHVFYKGVA